MTDTDLLGPGSGDEPKRAAARQITTAAELRHFAPYGATNAACDETVPRSIATAALLDGEHEDARFTARRDRTTCGECLWRLERDSWQMVPPAPAPEPDDREALAEALAEAERVFGWQYLRRYARMSDEWMDATLGAIVGRVLAWQRGSYPEPVKPSREDVARLIDPAAWGCHDSCNVCKTGRSSSLRQADAVLALWPGRSEADVLGDAADWIEGVDLDGQEHVAARLLRERGEGGAS